jgi:GNAT superfamily N-acetyltransferase
MLIRPASPRDSRAIASIQVGTWRRTYPGIIPMGYLARLSRREKAREWKATLSNPGSSGFVLIAEERGRPVGFLAGGPERKRGARESGEIYAIYVRPPMQFRGVGRALFLAGVDCFLLLGFRSLVTWVLAANPYRRFYESLEGQRAASRSIRLGGKRLEEARYEWADIRPLVPEFVLPLV